MSRKHTTATRIDIHTTGYSSDFIDVESDLTSYSPLREVYVELNDAQTGSTALVLTREQVCKLMDVLTFHLEATAHIDHRSEDEF